MASSEDGKKLQVTRKKRELKKKVQERSGKLCQLALASPDECCRKLLQQDLVLVVDTNVLLRHLGYMKKIRTHGLRGVGFPIIVIPWVVLKELDSLKRRRGLSSSVARLATPAINYIYKLLKSREPRLWGQSMQQAAERITVISTGGDKTMSEDGGGMRGEGGAEAIYV